MAPLPPILVKHSATYWQCDDGPALLAWLQARPDFHPWLKAANDQRKAHGEKVRFYHKAPGSQWVEAAGLVLEKRRDGGFWIRTTGPGAARVERILTTLEAPAEPQPEQLQLVEVLS